MSRDKDLSKIRRDFGNRVLDEASMAACPFVQFNEWMTYAVQSSLDDPNAMVLSTVDEKGRPDSRVVLLKGVEDESFVFYSSYQADKALQIESHANVALNFYWSDTVRQVRIRGVAKKVSSDVSDAYFATRPFESQIAALLTGFSHEVANRQELETAHQALLLQHQTTPVKRPAHWGGYRVIPDEFEFFQGQTNRLHDRMHYYRQQNQWVCRRIAP